MPPKKRTKKKAVSDNDEQQPSPPPPQLPKRKRGAAEPNPKPAKKSKPSKKDAAAATPAKTPAPTPKQILEAHANNPPECYVIGPPGGQWVNNSKALAGYLGFKTTGEFRTWLTQPSGEDDDDLPVPSQVLESFRMLHENNYSKPAKVTGANRTNVPRSAIWDQLINNSQELMPQMQIEAGYVLRL